jgi:hypothetical protein
MNVVNEKPAQPLADTHNTAADVRLTAADARREPDTHRNSSRWSPWLGRTPRQGDDR